MAIKKRLKNLMTYIQCIHLEQVALKRRLTPSRMPHMQMSVEIKVTISIFVYSWNEGVALSRPILELSQLLMSSVRC